MCRRNCGQSYNLNRLNTNEPCPSFLQLVSSFQMEAQQKQTEAEVAQTKLSNVRKLIAKLLKTINEVR